VIGCDHATLFKERIAKNPCPNPCSLDLLISTSSFRALEPGAFSRGTASIRLKIAVLAPMLERESDHGYGGEAFVLEQRVRTP